MTDAAAVVSSPVKTRTIISELAFLVQVSRPGLWSTTALFYLMPLGHADVFPSRIFWVGLFYTLFPLGLVLYGVNDIVDADGDRFNPRKGTFLFGSLGASDQLVFVLGQPQGVAHPTDPIRARARGRFPAWAWTKSASLAVQFSQ